MLRRTFAVAAILTAVFAVYTVTRFGGDLAYGVATRVIYNAVLALAVLIILARGVLVARERWVWLLLGTGLGLWASANTYYRLPGGNLERARAPASAGSRASSPTRLASIG